MKVSVVKAAAYAVIGYQTAFLMKYYPVETIAAMLNSVMGTSEKIAHYIRFAESQGIQVLPPDINESFSKFTVKGDKIRFGLAAIKNVGFNVVESIAKSRYEKGEYKSLGDFVEKIDPSAVNKRAVESLIKAGALDSFKVFRSKLLAVFDKLMDSSATSKKKNIDGQINLFALSEDEEVKTPEVQYPNIKEFSKRHILAMEKEMSGLYLSGHPLDEYVSSLSMQTSTSIGKINEAYEALTESIDAELTVQEFDASALRDDQRVVIGGIIAEVNKKITRNNTMMAFLKLEDLEGIIEVVVFPKTLEKMMNLISDDALVLIKGRVSLKEDEPPKLICESIEPLEKVNNDKLYLRAADKKTAGYLKNYLKNLSDEFKGDTSVYIFLEENKQTYRMPKECWVNLESDVLDLLKDETGEGNIKVISK